MGSLIHRVQTWGMIKAGDIHMAIILRKVIIEVIK